MSILVNLAFSANLEAIPKLVYLAMLECSDDKETCDANTEKLKMMTTLGDEQMERALKSLEDLGLIHKLGYKFDIDKLRALTVRIK